MRALRLVIKENTDDLRAVYSMTTPYIVQVLVNDAGYVRSDDNAYVHISEEKYLEDECIRKFAEKVCCYLQNRYNMAILDERESLAGNSYCVSSALRFNDCQFKVHSEIGFILRHSIHPQMVPCSQETQHSRDVTKEELKERIKNWNRKLGMSGPSDPVVPDIDCSVVINSGSSDDDNFFGSDVQSAAEFVAKDMNRYVNENVDKALDRGLIETDPRLSWNSQLNSIDVSI